MATREEIARQAVLTTLRDPAVGRMVFGVGWVLILPNDYERVAKAIESGAITVHIDSSLPSHMAQYNSGANRLDVPPGGSDPALLIHESTHAIFDIRSLPASTSESEGIAYIAQALFGRLKYGRPRSRYMVSADPVNPVSWFGWQTIFDQSSALAEILVTTPYLRRDQVTMLFTAVSMTTTYINQGPDTSYNGVPGT